MNLSTSKFTVLFEDPFWIGVYERVENGRCQAAKVTFGPEPKDYEVYQFLLTNWRLLRFSPSVKAAAAVGKPANPKRLRRVIQKQTAASGVATKAQQALKLQQEAGKLARKARSRQEREAEKERQFQIRRQKQKEKHRGR